MGFPHVRVGHRQASNLKRPVGYPAGRFFVLFFYISPVVALPGTGEARGPSNGRMAWRFARKSCGIVKMLDSSAVSLLNTF